MKIAVLMGGVSRERPISMLSGEAVAAALAERGHEVLRIVVDDEEVEALARSDADVAFLALHGRFGEDGGIQRICERIGMPYTGSGPLASARALDKGEAKRAFRAAGVPTPAGFEASPPFELESIAAQIQASGGFPVVVKPVDEGSSIGVSIVRGESALGAALEEVAALGSAALVETYLPGRELTIGILGDAALPPVELVPKRAFYDYEAKYAQGSGTEYVVDPALEPSLRAEVLAIALAAHRALGCAGCSRVDVKLGADSRPRVLEVNTIPGMTARSLLPKAALAAGISFGELCERLMELALAAHPARERHAGAPHAHGAEATAAAPRK